MAQKRIKSFQHPLLRKEAAEVLGQNANRLRLIEALLICFTPLLLYLSLYNACYGVIFPMLVPADQMLWVLLAELSYTVLALLLSLFFTLPLLVGLLHLAERMEDGAQVPLSEVFYGFASPKNYGKALRISWGILWRGSLIWLIEDLIYQIFWVLSDGFWPILLGGILLMVAMAFLLFFLFCGGFFKPYRILRNPPKAKRMRPYARNMGYRYWLGFLPWLTLSLLTVGILALYDTLPRMLISYFRLSRKLNEMTTQSED